MKDFLISFVFNLIFHYKLLVLAVLAVLLHIFLNFPVLIAYVLLGLWIVIPLLITLGLGVLSRNTPPTPYQKNVNPYSTTTKNYTENSEKDDTESGA